MIAYQDYLYLRKHLPILEELSAANLLLWVQRMTPVQYEQGLILYNSGVDTIGMLLLKSGVLRIYLLSEEGREITLYRLRAGEICILSVSGALQQSSVDAQIESETECELLVLDTTSFSILCAASLPVENYFNRLFGRRLVVSMETMERVLFMSMEQRLAFFLVNEVLGTRRDCVELTHDQIARHIGSTREVVTRILGSFSVKGLVELSRGCLVVLERGKLESLYSPMQAG